MAGHFPKTRKLHPRAVGGLKKSRTTTPPAFKPVRGKSKVFNRFEEDSRDRNHTFTSLEGISMPPAVRPAMLVGFLIFAGLGTWQYFGYRGTKEETFHFWVAVVLLVVAMGALLGFFLTKPEDDPSDISITKF